MRENRWPVIWKGSFGSFGKRVEQTSIVLFTPSCQASGSFFCMVSRRRSKRHRDARSRLPKDDLRTLSDVKAGNDMATEPKRDYTAEGRRAYEEWRDGFLADPENRKIYEEEAAKKDLWLQLVEARQSAGLTQAELAKKLDVSQAQVARLEKRGYDCYSLN